MHGCAWLTEIDRHALHVPCTSRLGSLAKPYLRWSLQGPGAFTLDLLVKVFMSSQQLRGNCAVGVILYCCLCFHVAGQIVSQI
jgi:hypothetical protein